MDVSNGLVKCDAGLTLIKLIQRHLQLLAALYILPLWIYTIHELHRLFVPDKC